jgi:hypothetical protein
MNDLVQLLTHPVPVNKLAVKVAFWKGDHFSPTFPEHHLVRTIEIPPRCSPRPKDAVDHTGLRHGRMTAISWFRRSKGKKNKAINAVWVARCDCGRYEFRRPGNWLNHPSPEIDPDRCEYCRRIDTIKNKGNSKDKMPNRLMAWIRSMRAIGLTDEEIVQIRKSEGINTKGCTAEKIRASLNSGELHAQHRGVCHV